MQHCTLSVCPVFKQSVYISKFVLFQFTLGCFNFGLMTTTYKSMKMCMLEKFVKCLYWLVNQILKNGKICPKNDPSRPHRWISCYFCKLWSYFCQHWVSFAPHRTYSRILFFTKKQFFCRWPNATFFSICVIFTPYSKHGNFTNWFCKVRSYVYEYLWKASGAIFVFCGPFPVKRCCLVITAKRLSVSPRFGAHAI